ncbi:uncharacterized protein [Malus domestica]|uniref:uncharacterized protein n=1 Tax=Malus domestica TaxID=3750 RepID=UPI003977147B
MSTMTSSAPSSYWLTDSGASHHVTTNPSTLNSVIPYYGSDQLFVGDGKASHNLLSVYKFVYDNWCSLTFDPFGFYVKDLRTAKMLFQGPSEDGLYPFYWNASNGVSSIAISPTALIIAKADIYIWHRVLGHPSWEVLHSIVHKNNLLVIGSVRNFLNHSGYRCLDPITNRLYISRHVVFDESLFPYKHLSSLISSQRSCSPKHFNPPMSLSLPLPVPHSEKQPNTPASYSEQQDTTSPVPDLIPFPTTSFSTGTSPTTLPTSSSFHPPTPVNNHLMITSAKVGIHKPKVFTATKHQLPSAVDSLTKLSITPSTFLQASKHSHWMEAMQSEFQALQSTGTWELVPNNPTYNLVDCKWVFKVKHKPDGTIEKYKARLVAKGPNLISWSAKKQATVTRSSTEAEYKSLANTAAEITWVCKILQDISFPLLKTLIIYCDNKSAIALAFNHVFHARTKHVEIDYHYIREKVLLGHIGVQHVASLLQIADIFTKSLAADRFAALTSKLSI